jgi:MYXO-CTERM domain-containing protein
VTMIPEPATELLSIGGLLLVAGLSWRRRRK